MLKLVLFFHFLGAAIWTGGHLVLVATILPKALKQRNPGIILDFESGYERIGIPALIVQVVTGLWLAQRLVPEMGDWFSLASVASRHIVAKLVLLLFTLGLALHARLKIIPHLSPETLPKLAWHVVGVTLLALLFVLLGVGFRTGGLF